jgi:hypothetical protein
VIQDELVVLLLKIYMIEFGIMSSFVKKIIMVCITKRDIVVSQLKYTTLILLCLENYTYFCRPSHCQNVYINYQLQPKTHKIVNNTLMTKIN